MYLDVLNKISKLPSAQRTVVKSLGDMSFRNALLKYKSIADKYKPEAGSVQNKTIGMNKQEGQTAIEEELECIEYIIEHGII